MTPYEKKAREDNAKLERIRAAKNAEMLKQQVAAKLAIEQKKNDERAKVKEPVIVEDDYVPDGYRGHEPTGDMGRFWFALEGEGCWVDEHGQRWPSSSPPVDSVGGV